MRKVALIAGIIVGIVVLVVLGLAFVQRDRRSYPLVITKPGMYQYASGKRAVEVKPWTNDRLRVLLHERFSGRTRRRGLRSTTTFPPFRLSPKDKWLVYVQSRDVVWIYDGKKDLCLTGKTLGFLYNYDPKITSRPVEKIDTSVAAQVPKDLLTRLPKDMQKRISEGR